MPSTNVKRLSLWEIAFSLLMLALAANTVRGLRDPDFLRFFGFWLVVAVIVGAIGSLVALLLVWFRRIAGSSNEDPGRRLF